MWSPIEGGRTEAELPLFFQHITGREGRREEGGRKDYREGRKEGGTEAQQRQNRGRTEAERRQNGGRTEAELPLCCLKALIVEEIYIIYNTFVDT